jgi:hypothetical protein
VKIPSAVLQSLVEVTRYAATCLHEVGAETTVTRKPL